MPSCRRCRRRCCETPANGLTTPSLRYRGAAAPVRSGSKPEIACSNSVFGHPPPDARSTHRAGHDILANCEYRYSSISVESRGGGVARTITSMGETRGRTMKAITGTAADNYETAKWDPAFTEQMANALGPLVKRWFRAEVRNVENVPQAGGALVVSNHSGGMFTPDVLILAPAFYNTFGYHRPLYTLAHYGLFIGPLDGWFRRIGVIEASRENAAAALHSDAGCWCSRAVTTIPIGPRAAQTPSTSTAAPAMSVPPSKPECRSCRQCRSAPRRPSCSSPGATFWPAY